MRREIANESNSARSATSDAPRILVKVDVDSENGRRVYYYVCRKVIHAMRAATKKPKEIRHFSVENLGEVLFAAEDDDA